MPRGLQVVWARQVDGASCFFQRLCDGTLPLLMDWCCLGASLDGIRSGSESGADHVPTAENLP